MKFRVKLFRRTTLIGSGVLEVDADKLPAIDKSLTCLGDQTREQRDEHLARLLILQTDWVAANLCGSRVHIEDVA